jgi:hypothetical protein
MTTETATASSMEVVVLLSVTVCGCVVEVRELLALVPVLEVILVAAMGEVSDLLVPAIVVPSSMVVSASVPVVLSLVTVVLVSAEADSVKLMPVDVVLVAVSENVVRVVVLVSETETGTKLVVLVSGSVLVDVAVAVVKEDCMPVSVVSVVELTLVKVPVVSAEVVVRVAVLVWLIVVSLVVAMAVDVKMTAKRASKPNMPLIGGTVSTMGSLYSYSCA